MAWAPLAIMAAGTIMSAMSQKSAGDAAAATGAAHQQVLAQQAGQDRAQGSAQAAEQDMKTKYVISTLRARAAASGGSATDPTTLNLAGAIAARGSYNVLSSVYSADEKAIGTEYQGVLDNYAGQTKQDAGNMMAFSTILSSAGSMYGKYGGGAGAQT